MMTWNVFYHNCNTDKIETFNIFRHGRFREDVAGALNRYKDKNLFDDSISASFFYYFCGKVNCEVLIKAWVGCDVEIKMDIYDQVMMNWDRFVDYVWSFKE